MNRILSIVIPTKNRQKYCLEAIKSIHKFCGSDVEIVIQDNSDTDDLNEQIIELGYDNIIYNYHKGVLSFVDNFSEAINISTGEYLCMIGDDDSVLPNIKLAVEYMKNNKIECLVPKLSAVYIWPSTTPYDKLAKNGKLSIYKEKNKYSEINVTKALKKLLKNGGQGYQNLHLPRIYHGIVKRTCLDEIKKEIGSYFGGLTPDIFNAVSLSFCTNKVVYFDSAITISGICPRSASAASATGEHTGTLSSAPHFIGHTCYEWDFNAPSIYCVETIWGETVLHTLKLFNRLDLYSVFNVCALDAICLVKHHQFKKEILCHIKSVGISKKKLYSSVVLFFITGVIRRLKNCVTNEIKHQDYYCIDTISEAINVYEERLGKNRNVII